MILFTKSRINCIYNARQVFRMSPESIARHLDKREILRITTAGWASRRIKERRTERALHEEAASMPNDKAQSTTGKEK